VEHSPLNDDNDEDAEDTGPKILSKKEKEKLKKEREKVYFSFMTCQI
jgi:translation initiation factor 5B